MRLLPASRTWYYVGAGVLLLAVALWYWRTHQNSTEGLVTATVDRGTVTQVVSVSGAVEAKNTADLAFPTTGKVTEVFVDEGSIVAAGEVLATLGSATLAAERSEAAAALRAAEAQLNETVAGASEETRRLAATKLANAEASLERIQTEEALKVENAHRALRSNQLEARPVEADEKAATPSVSGSYECSSEGTYRLSIYAANSLSGYAIRFSGLESGTTEAFVDHPGPLGTCGLFVQLVAGELYSNSEWTIAIPNTNASAYITYQNAYDLARKQATNAVAAAKNAVALAREEARVTTADARSEVVSQRQAAVNQARARIAAIDAQLADRSIIAPFSGTVTEVRVIGGETATLEPVITLLAEDAFKLIARIPEIDITKVATGQRAVATFDAAPQDIQTGSIIYISPLATEIDGVAYFETTITLDTKPTWLRAGLNADVAITTAEHRDMVRVPKRFLTISDDTAVATLLRVDTTVTTPVEILFTGNDGYAAVTGLNVGDVVVAP